jgi:hypothetical protein
LTIPRRRRLAGTLLVVSGITHLAQIFVYDDAAVLAGVALFGVLYFAIGCLILGGRRSGLWLGATAPVVGGIGGTIRLFLVQPNPFSAVHVLIDLVVVPICVYELGVANSRED